MTPSDHIRTMFATFDAKDVSALAAFMTDVWSDPDALIAPLKRRCPGSSGLCSPTVS
jgi:hypothetical protein